MRAFDLQGELFELEAEELLSRAIQHETDHLDGKLFIDYVGPLARHSLKPKLQEFEGQFRQAQASGEYPADHEIIEQLHTMTDLPPILPGPLSEHASQAAES